MEKSEYTGVYKAAFINRLKTIEYKGSLKDEIVTENWYRLSFEEANRFIKSNDYLEHKVKKESELNEDYFHLLFNKLSISESLIEKLMTLNCPWGRIEVARPSFVRRTMKRHIFICIGTRVLPYNKFSGINSL